MVIDYDAFQSFMRPALFSARVKRILMSIILKRDVSPSKYAWLITSIFVCLTPTLAHAEDTTSVLSIPKEWRIENTTYPPPWAKSLPWSGKIELRFPPGFFKPTSIFFWSYPILYQLDGNCINHDVELKRALLDYDAGLYGDKYSRQQIEITIQKPKRKHPSLPTVLTFKGFDPFTTLKPLTTYMEIQRRYDPVTDITTILILRSARPIDKKDTVWKTLYRFRKDAGF